MKAFRSISLVVVLLALAGLFGLLLNQWHPHAQTSALAQDYLTQGPGDLHCANAVTSVVVTFRGLDTLGEVTVLFSAALAAGLILRRRKTRAPVPTPSEQSASPLLQIALLGLCPVIFLLGFYIIANGHLSPGGGFQGGAVLASGFLAIYLADLVAPVGEPLLKSLEAGSGFFYLLTGVAGIALGLGFLDATILPLGTLGQICSAGSIPLVYTLIGLKVGSELTAITERFKGDEAHG